MRDRFHWARLLSFVTGLVNQDLLLRNEYLTAENRILRSHVSESSGSRCYSVSWGFHDCYERRGSLNIALLDTISIQGQVPATRHDKTLLRLPIAVADSPALPMLQGNRGPE